ncbi:MAG TPA: VCBS repeat-containing protein, partial [Polyangiaceae bacterium]
MRPTRTALALLVPNLLAVVACGSAPSETKELEARLAQESAALTTVDFTAVTQSYPGLDFGVPSLWEPITGDFDGDKRTDYARLGSTGAWVYFANGGRTFTQAFQDYAGLAFGEPSPWQTITGDFNGDGRT